MRLHMDLQDWPDSEVDGCINAALRAGTPVTNRQKQHAWEQLRLKAGQQAILPPVKSSRMLTPVFSSTTLKERMLRPCRSIAAWIGDLMVDDGQYARAS